MIILGALKSAWTYATSGRLLVLLGAKPLVNSRAD